jgi:hypothetical protein
MAVGETHSNRNKFANYMLLVGFQVRQFLTPIMTEEELLFHLLKAYHQLRQANASMRVLDRLAEIVGVKNYHRMSFYRKHALYVCGKLDEFVSLFDEQDVELKFRFFYLVALIRRKETMEDAYSFICRYPNPDYFVVMESGMIVHGLEDEFSSRLRSLQDDFSSHPENKLLTGSKYYYHLLKCFSRLKRDDLTKSLFEEKLRNASDLSAANRSGIFIVF